MSPNQFKIKLITKSNQNLRLHLKVKKMYIKWRPLLWYCEKRTKTYKKGQICKKHENWFYVNWLSQEKRSFEENKTFTKSNLFFNS